MRIVRAKDYDDMSRKAANIISAQVIIKPDTVLGLATGSTPLGTYRQLIDWYKKGDLDFSEVSSVNLDEYRGLSPENDQSYRYFMDYNFFSQINIRPEKTFVPDGLAEDPDAACKSYDEIIQSTGGVDLQLLGLGLNGHIGFNEPTDEFRKGTHCVDLTESTIEANKRFFESEKDVPRQAYTMGIGTIMRADKVLLLISGKAKAKILSEVLFGPVTAQVPGSILQFHKDLIVVADEEALSEFPQ